MQSITGFHLAEMNISRMLAPLESETMAPFRALLPEVNAAADRSAGFVWRYQDGSGDATYLRLYDDPLIIVNISVWETPAALQGFLKNPVHAEAMRQRRAWFHPPDEANFVMWWIPAGTLPTPEEAVRRLTLVRKEGDSSQAFTSFKAHPTPPSD